MGSVTPRIEYGSGPGWAVVIRPPPARAGGRATVAAVGMAVGLLVALFGWGGVLSGRGATDGTKRAMGVGSAEALVVAWAAAAAGTGAALVAPAWWCWNARVAESAELAAGALVIRRRVAGVGVRRVIAARSIRAVEAVPHREAGGVRVRLSVWDLTAAPGGGHLVVVRGDHGACGFGIDLTPDQAEQVAGRLRAALGLTSGPQASSAAGPGGAADPAR